MCWFARCIVARSGSSTIGTRIGPWVGHSSDHGLISDRDKRYFSSPMHPHWLWGPPTVLCSGYRGSYCGGKVVRFEASCSALPGVAVWNVCKLHLHFPIWLLGTDWDNSTLYTVTRYLTKHQRITRGTWWRIWLRYSTTSCKVMGSLPIGVIGIFYSFNCFGWVDSASNRNECQGCWLGWRQLVHRTDNFAASIFQFSRNSVILNLLEA